jgi:peptidoglycan/LPS O-acetylase OafA/YrhL
LKASGLGCRVVLGHLRHSLIVGAPFGILTRFRFVGAVLMLSAVNLLFVGAMSFALLVATGRWKSASKIPVLAFYGDISYGFYLIHWLIFIGYDAVIARYLGPAYHFAVSFKLLAMHFCIVFVAATFLAWLSRRFYEERLLRLKSRFT